MFKVALIATFVTLSLCGGWGGNNDNTIYGNCNRLSGNGNTITGN